MSLRQRATLVGLALAVAATVGIAERDIEPTPDVGLGPNFLPGAPFRAKLSPPFADGEVLVVKGRVRAADTGKPLSGTVLEAFHADAKGNYDMQGFDYRGRVITDEQGRFEFETIRPANYGPPPHIHFLIHHAGYRKLETELFFKEDLEAQGRLDRHPAALVTELVKRTVNGHEYLEGSFDVVLVPE